LAAEAQNAIRTYHALTSRLRRNDFEKKTQGKIALGEKADSRLRGNDNVCRAVNIYRLRPFLYSRSDKLKSKKHNLASEEGIKRISNNECRIKKWIPAFAGMTIFDRPLDCARGDRVGNTQTRTCRLSIDYRLLIIDYWIEIAASSAEGGLLAMTVGNIEFAVGEPLASNADRYPRDKQGISNYEVDSRSLGFALRHFDCAQCKQRSVQAALGTCFGGWVMKKRNSSCSLASSYLIFVKDRPYKSRQLPGYCHHCFTWHLSVINKMPVTFSQRIWPNTKSVNTNALAAESKLLI